MFRALCKVTLNFRTIIRSKYVPIYRFSTINGQQQRQKIIDYFNSLPHTNSSVKQIQFSQLQEHQLFEQLEQLALNKQLNTTQLVQSLNYLDEDRYVHPVLYMLYPSLNSLSDSSLTFVFQKILSYKPPQLPPVPQPRMITENEMLFFILGQMFQPKQMIGWIERVPFWQDNSNTLTLLAMGIFTIYNKMSKIQKDQYAGKMNKCNQIIQQSLGNGQFGDEFISILTLALQLQNPFAQKMLNNKTLHWQQISSNHLLILFTNMSMYLPNGQKSKVIEQILNEVVVQVVKLNWKTQNSINVMDLWNTLYNRSTYKGVWISFGDKLMNFTRNYIKFSNNEKYNQKYHQQYNQNNKKLESEDLIKILQTLNKHYINKKQLLHDILIQLQPYLVSMNTNDLVRLVKALTIYVKIQQHFFMHLRKICDNRKFQFSPSEVKQLKNIYSRFQVLFSNPF